jgi:TRAP-type C4-dicarboxylate transport system permease small subunit
VSDRGAAQDADSGKARADGRIGGVLERVCGFFAMLGGALLVGMILVSSLSVIGRSLPQLAGMELNGIPGDIEIVQLGCAVAVFFFLPLCQLKRANVLVGVFTKRLPVRYRAMFDLAANLLYLMLALVLAVQLGHGMAEKFRNHDTTMVLRIPEGAAYAAALGAAWLLVLVALYTAARSIAEIRTNRAIGPQPAGEH